MAVLVRHAMTEAPKALSPSMSANEAAGVMANFDVGVVPVADGDHLIGLVTDRDLVTRVLATRADPKTLTLGEIATTAVVQVSPDMELVEARDLMAAHQIRRLPVVKNHRLVGIISLGDVALAAASKRSIGETLEDISDSDSTRDLNEGPAIGTPEK